MHQAFTGSTRKSRQVNLGGRSATNPWAALPGSAKSSHGIPATQSTVAQAQADRLRRQHERDRTVASRKLQQIWRGHAARRFQKMRWREEWDDQERKRLWTSEQIHYERVLSPGFRVPAYESTGLLLYQLRHLVHFQEFRRGVVRDEMDTARVLYFARALRTMPSNWFDSNTDKRLTFNLSRLGLVAVRHIRSLKSISLTPSGEEAVRQLSQLLSYVVTLVPDDMIDDAPHYLKVLRQVIEPRTETGTQDSGVDAILALLSASQYNAIAVYASFAREILSDELLSTNERVLSRFASELDQTGLAEAMKRGVLKQQHGSSTALAGGYELWQLSYLTYFHRQNQRSMSKSGPQIQTEYIEAMSLLLGLCANEIADGLEIDDNHADNSIAKYEHSLSPFTREALSFTAQQDSVKGVISVLSRSRNSPAGAQSEFRSAKLLANYAVAMLRAFPSKATNIRMWLYQGSITLASGKDISIIQYLWSITSTTGVFKKISRNHRSVMSAMREAAPDNNQIGRAPVSAEKIDQWREEWRIILLFFELYSFVLKLMDDEDFFSLDTSEKYGTVVTSSSQFRRSALPLTDIASMTTFLKNLAFTLYWNAADLVETNDAEEIGGIAALFGASTSAHKPTRAAEKPRAQTLAGNGVSQIYMKDLATGLLRMLHERDSRRNFLPQNHWLMTSQVDMAGFIPAVTAEEERRHELAEEDEDEEDDTESTSIATVDGEENTGSSLLRSMFGIREPHTPRSMTSRHAEKLERQRMQARKRRQLESLAPRLEILRNLPFFIPFETRVQIFREFVYRDQIRRRNGYVDPDNWRMNVANTTQGRGLDGRPRGLDVISRQHAEIHRESVFEDAYASFYELGDGLKEPIQISFIDKFGAPEAGIDGGGVTKEFLMSVTSEAFDPKGDLSMFQENDQRYLYPNPVIFEETAEHLRRAGLKLDSENFTWQMREFLRRFEFIGRVVGKCLYEGILIDVSFAGFFLLKWALTGGSTSASNETAYRATINDLRDYDEELYQGLLKLKNYPGDVELDFGLTFTVSDTLHIDDGRGGEIVHNVTRDLIPNGSNTPVTNTNRLLYLDKIVRYRLQEQPRRVTNAFLKGLGQIIQPMWLAMFNQKELQKLVGGDNTELDIADLRRNTLYGGLYMIGDDGLEHPTVELFWRVLKEMDDGDRRKVLKFVTSTPRAPLLGFSHLNPKFSIRDSSEDQTRLPSTSTCVNLLKLPRYGDVQTMREKLLYAVNAGAGFDLS